MTLLQNQPDFPQGVQCPDWEGAEGGWGGTVPRPGVRVTTVLLHNAVPHKLFIVHNSLWTSMSFFSLFNSTVVSSL